MSRPQVAALLVDMFAQCGRLDYTLANTVREEEQRILARRHANPGSGAKSPAVASSMAVKGDHDEAESSSSDEDDDMGEDRGAGAGDEPPVAEPNMDGWETVSSKKTGKGRR